MRLALLLIAGLAGAGCAGLGTLERRSGADLFLFQNPRTGLYGYLRNDGSVAIWPRFARASEFSGGVAVVEERIAPPRPARRAVIDAAGEVLVQSEDWGTFDGPSDGVITFSGEACTAYDLRGRRLFTLPPGAAEFPPRFSEGLAAYQANNGKYGYINKNGELQVQPRFDFAGPFRNGLALVATGFRSEGFQAFGGEWSYIDANGCVVWNWQLPGCRSFEFDLAAQQRLPPDLFRIMDPDTGRYGYMDRTGHVAIPPAYDTAGDFADGVAVVGRFDGTEHQYHYSVISAHGKPAIDDDHICQMMDSRGGVLCFSDEYGVCGAYSASGRLLFRTIAFQWASQSGFVDGRSVVSIGQKMGYTDRKGRLVGAKQYDFAWPFRNGLALTNCGGRRTQAPAAFRDGIAGGTWAYIDRRGTPVFSWNDAVPDQ